MAQFFFSRKIDAGKTLCLAPLSERMLMNCADEILDTSGYFLFERCERGDIEDIDILAHVTTDEAAIRISDMMGLK